MHAAPHVRSSIASRANHRGISKRTGVTEDCRAAGAAGWTRGSAVAIVLAAAVVLLGAAPVRAGMSGRGGAVGVHSAEYTVH